MVVDLETAQRVEQLAANAWPAARTQAADGWLFRASPGVRRRRSNSALPVAVEPGGAGSYTAAIELAEAFYVHNRLACWVQVSPLDFHAGLDAELAARGYERASPVEVHVAALDQVLAFGAAVARPSATAGITMLEQDRVTPAWLAAQMAVEPRSPAAQEAEARWVLERICPPVLFVTALQGDRPAGVCLFAAERGWTGVLSMAVHPAARRQGVASAMLHAGASWAGRHGVANLYLQVEEGNHGAIALYRRAGFGRAYSYHYRHAGQGGPVPPDGNGKVRSRVA